MKKLFTTFLAGVCALSCAFAFTACGDNTPTPPPAHKHSWAQTWQKDETHHWHNCTAEGCDITDNAQKDGYAAHDFTNGNCVCGKEKPAHQHTWSQAWQSDDTHHWHNCTAEGCDITDNAQKDGYAAHDFTNGNCVCGKEKPTVPVTGVELNKTAITLEIGDEETLTATVAPDNATDKTVTWTVAPAGVVTVDDNGKVTAVKDGTATITATAGTQKATCAVTVNAPLTNAQVLKFLNDNVLMNAAKSCLSSNWEVNNENTINPTWFVAKDGKQITSVNLIFNYLRRADTTYVILCNIEFTTPLTLQNIQNNEIGTPTYTEVYRKGINPTIQAEHAALTNAICNKLFGANTTDTRYIIDHGTIGTDEGFADGDASRYTVIEITDTTIKEQRIHINLIDTDDNKLINCLNDTAKYYTFGEEKKTTITGAKLENNDEPFFG